MSDEEFEYEYDEDGGGYVEEGGEEGGGEDDISIQIANAFYEADDMKARAPQAAIDGFNKVVTLEKESGAELEWSFKALTALVLLHIQLGQQDEMVSRYRELLGCIGNPRVTSNATTEAINSVLDKLSTVSWKDQTALATMYAVTLKALKEAKVERMWFVVSMKLARLHVDLRQLAEACELTNQLHNYCTIPGTDQDDPGKAAQLIEIYAMRMELVPLLKHTNVTPAGFLVDEKIIYNRMQSLIRSAAISDPRIMGGVHESFAMLHMASEKWTDAYDEFYTAFRCYSDSGNAAARRCLKYVVLANMLALSQINPFDTQEAKVYKDDPEVFAMWRLREAYSDMNFAEFNKVLNNPRNRIITDDFIVKYIAPLNRQVVLSVIKETLKSYRTIRLDFLAKLVNVTREQLEELLVGEILDGNIVGTVDQVGGFLELKPQQASSGKYSAVTAWAEKLTTLSTSQQGKLYT